MRVKPIVYTEHAVRILTGLNLSRSVADDIMTGERIREGKVKFKARRRTKRGIIVVTAAEYPDHIKVITVDVVGGGR